MGTFFVLKNFGIQYHPVGLPCFTANKIYGIEYQSFWGQLPSPRKSTPTYLKHDMSDGKPESARDLANPRTHHQRERERGRANYSLFRFFRHDHVPPSLRVPVHGRRGCLRDHHLCDRALGLVVLRMPSADDRRPPSSPSFSVDDGVISPPHRDICDDASQIPKIDL